MIPRSSTLAFAIFELYDASKPFLNPEPLNLLNLLNPLNPLNLLNPSCPALR